MELGFYRYISYNVYAINDCHENQLKNLGRKLLELLAYLILAAISYKLCMN